MVSRRNLQLATVASATLLNPLNSSMISVALPSLGDEFGLSFAGVTWLVSIFYLTSAVAQPVVGRLGDVYGKRRVFSPGSRSSPRPACSRPSRLRSPGSCSCALCRR